MRNWDFPNSTVRNPQIPKMKNRGRRTLGISTISDQNIHINNNAESPTQSKKNMSSSSVYEEEREQRIKANLERLQKLGIFDLSLKLKTFNPSKKKQNYTVRKTVYGSSPLQPRRSSRLQNVTPPTYEVHKKKIERSLPRVRRVKEYWNEVILLGKGPRTEIYTEEHGKLLGDCKTSWTLCVDGYGENGRRVYDSFTGKTCHQCRQKTLGHRTHCSQCNMFQGQFCGDCLYMRYGENVLEANENPDWICPVCRGICNCSLCRKAKGWAPTGYLYRKVESLGFKSVAHYLIQTHRHSDDNSSAKPLLFARRSIPFSDMEAPSSKVIDDKGDVEIKTEEKSEMHDIYTDREERKDNISAKVNYDHLGLSELKSISDIKIELESVSRKPKCASAFEPSTDSIGARLRKRLKEEKIHEQEVENNAVNCEDDGSLFVSNIDVKIDLESVSRKHKCASALEPSKDSIGARLRKRRKEEKILEHKVENIAVNCEDDGSLLLSNIDVKIKPETSSRKQNCTSTNEVSPDSIGGRLRQRRKEDKSREEKKEVLFYE